MENEPLTGHIRKKIMLICKHVILHYFEIFEVLRYFYVIFWNYYCEQIESMEKDLNIIVHENISLTTDMWLKG